MHRMWASFAEDDLDEDDDDGRKNVMLKESL